MLAYCFQSPTGIHGAFWLEGTKGLCLLLEEADLHRQNQDKDRGETFEESCLIFSPGCTQGCFLSLYASDFTQALSLPICTGYFLILGSSCG